MCDWFGRCALGDGQLKVIGDDDHDDDSGGAKRDSVFDL
jgi:hypothetical protein